MHKNEIASPRGIKKECVKNQRQKSNDSLVNCDNKTNQCDRYSLDALLSGQKKSSKLSIDDESSRSINGSNTNNKSERKRNIKMLYDGENKTGDGCEGDCDVKRIKVEGNVDGHERDNNKSKMYQVSIWKGEIGIFLRISVIGWGLFESDVK